MADNSISISDSGSGTEGITVIARVPISDRLTPKNLFPLNVADCTNTTGTTEGVLEWHGATVISDTTQYYRGNRCLKFTTSASESYSGFVIPSVNLKAGRTYTQSAVVKGIAGTTLRFTKADPDFVDSPVFTMTGDWQLIYATFVSSIDTINLFLTNGANVGVQEFRVGQMQVELGSSVTEWVHPGAIDSASVKTKLTLADQFTPRNLLSADQSTGGDYTNGATAFNSNGGSFVRDTTEAWQGTGCIKHLGTVQGAGVGNVSINATPGKTYTYSVWVKGSGIISIWGSERTASDTLIGNSATGGFVLTNQWQRISVTRTFTTGVKTKIWVMHADTPGSTVTMYVDGWMIEEGSSFGSEWQCGNLFTYNQQTVETDLTGLTGARGTFTRDTTDFYKGTASAKLVANGDTGACYIIHNPTSIVVKPDTTYLFQVKTKAICTGTNQLRIRIDWYTSASVFIRTDYGYVHKNDQWTNSQIVIKSPSNAGKFNGYIDFTNNPAPAGDIMWWDEAWLMEYPMDELKVKAKIPIKDSTLLANVATCGDMTDDLAGFTPRNSAILTRVTDEKYGGTGCVKVDVNNIATGLRLSPRLQLKPYTTYTISAWVKFPNTNTLAIRLSDETNWAGETIYTGTGDWQRIWTTFTTDDTLDWNIHISTPTTQTFTFWVDCIMIDEGSVLYDWKMPSYENLSLKVRLPAMRDYSKSKNKCLPNPATGGDYAGNATEGIGGSGSLTKTYDTTERHSGVGSIKCTATLYQTVQIYTVSGEQIISPGMPQTISVWVKSTSGKAIRPVIYYYDTGGMKSYQSTEGSGVVCDDWTKLTLTVTAPISGALTVFAGVRGLFEVGDVFWVDECQFEDNDHETEWEMPGKFDSISIKTNIPMNEGAVNPNVITEGLAGYWRFEEGSGISVADISGNGNTGTLTGTPLPTWMPETVRGGLKFVHGYSGGNRVDISNSSLEILGEITYCTWIKPEYFTNTYQGIMGKGGTTVGVQLWTYGGRLEAYVGNGSKWVANAFGSTLEVGKWYHVGMTISLSTQQIKLYLNGNQIDTRAITEAWSYNTNPFKIGMAQGYGGAWNGQIDETRVYNRALTTEEIRTIIANSGVASSDYPSIKNKLTIPDYWKNKVSMHVATCGDSDVWESEQYSLNQQTGGDELESTEGFTAQPQSTITRVTTEAHSGTGCIKVHTNGASNYEGVIFTPSATYLEGTYLEFTAWVKAPLNVLLWVKMGDSVGTSTVNFTGTGDWQQILVTRVLYSNWNPSVQISTQTTQNIDFYVDGLTLKSKGTGNIIGADSRGTIEYTTEEAWKGEGCIKNTTTTSGGVYQGCYFSVPISPYRWLLARKSKYTASCYVKGEGQVYIKLTEYAGGTAITAIDGAPITLTNEWQRISVSHTFGETGTNARVTVRKYVASNSVFYVDGFQFEDGDLSDFTLPGGDDIPQVKNKFTLPDLNVGVVDLPLVKNKLNAPDNAISIDDISLKNTIPIPELGNYLETIDVKNSFTVLDSGEFDELISILIRNIITESATTSEEIVIKNSFTVFDEAIGRDEVIKHLVHFMGDLLIVKEKDYDALLKKDTNYVAILKRDGEIVVLSGGMQP